MSRLAHQQPLILARIWRRRFARFLVIGVLNTLFGYAAFYTTLALSREPTLSVIVATALGVLFNFRSTGSVVFGSRDPRLLARFVLVYAFLAFCNVLALRLLALFGFSAALGQATLLLPLALISYLLNRELVFTKTDVAEAAR